MAKYIDNNGVLYLWNKIKTLFVQKESGKGLSTNDFTNEEKAKLAGIAANANNYTLPTASTETLGGVKVGSGLEINEGVLSATGGGTADSVEWSNVQNKPNTFPPSAHNHDTDYLKLSGGTMTGPINFSADQAQIGMDGTTAATKIKMGETETEILFDDKQNNLRNRVTVSKTGVVMKAGVTLADGAETPDTGVSVTINKTDGVKIPMVADPTNDQDAANKKYVDQKIAAIPPTDLSGYYKKTETYSKTEIDGKGFLTATDIANKADKATTLAGYGITDAYTKTEVDGKLSSVYKPAGAVNFADLPTPAAENVGFVYSVNDAFTTDDRFLASQPTQYPIGTNVVVVAVQAEPTTKYLFDVLAGFVDLSGYWKKTDLVAITNQEIDEIIATVEGS